jgi:hypothetical protein
VQLFPGETLQKSGIQNYHQYAHRSLWIPLVNAHDCVLNHQGHQHALDAHHIYGFNADETYSFEYVGKDRFLGLWIETPKDLELPSWIHNSQDFIPNPQAHIAIVPYCFRVMNPLEMVDLLTTLKAELQSQTSSEQYESLKQNISHFAKHWEKAFHQFGYSLKGELFYQDLILFFKEKIITQAAPHLDLKGRGYQSLKIISSILFPTEETQLRQFSRRVMAKRKQDLILNSQQVDAIPHFEQPVFIVSAPRAGSTLLFETLSRFEQLWSIGKESHDLIEGISELHPQAHGYHSNRLTAESATPGVIEDLKKRFVAQLRDAHHRFYLHLDSSQRPNPLRLLEKTPKNALRIPFLNQIFPDARFIYLYRDPAPNISSMLEGWRLRRFVSYRNLPDWPHSEWNFLLTPGWETLKESSLAEIVAHQWTAANAHILQDLQALPKQQWQFINFDDLVTSPQQTIRQLCKFAGLKPDATIEQSLAEGLPISCMTLSASSPDKWRKYEDEINPVLSLTHSVCSLVEELQ